MNCVLLILYVTLLHSVLTSLPAPVNVSIDSHNFYHVLRWDPGPGTPPGTVYNITQRDDEKEELLTSNTTSLDLLLDNMYEYHLTVQAFYNLTQSKKSKEITFIPSVHTHIDPAEVSLSGCGNCIQVNISMPEPYWGSGIQDLYDYYDPTFKLFWRKATKKPLNSSVVETHDKSYILGNLERGEYCVKVVTEIRINRNTKASAWKCTFTSPEEEQNTGFAALGVGLTLMIVVVGALMISLSFLYYTGFLGKLQATVPRALIVALRQGHTLTPETTRTYLISDTSQIEKQRMHNHPTASHVATSDANSEDRSEDEEEEDNEKYDYLDRDAELSTDESSCSRTSVSDHRKPAVTGNSSSSQLEEPPAEFDTGLVQGGPDQDDSKEATVSFTSEEGQSNVKKDCKVNACDSSGNVNLFSVTISALLVDVEEEQHTRDTLTTRDSDMTLNNAHTQMTESDNQVTVASTCPSQKAFTNYEYEGRHAHEEEEEEEEEEASEYMKHV
ncbi:cytokine receptor family member b1 isoform X2 [Betta splendens]|uniref:Cytokine receptor family member b1 isoform X2 n=1 Tax=Betta splendens TaxID=158456 RepID=A0A9W2XHX7_BETSP|nr:cytokine receptor family member b1 isoform X2 [Betta splendens]